MSDADQYTIGQLAKAAGVGVETIRYYQRRELLPVPEVASGFRTYPARLAERIRFIKRAQELGFSLDEIANLLMLEDGNDRQAIRDVAQERLSQVKAKLADLHRMEDMLTELIHQCASSTEQAQCPIIQALASDKPAEGKACQH
ncbi:MerR family transcriptional regulator [Undibacterium sp. YM2]|uniref:MerR family transcriptional regulator n=1 Tax=Undibacterium sp. YM2 TaxID=2058625 RepID=UPI001331DA0E|nr:MerR family transcriptional regulator [Undibacterium sp. YM2]BBB65506.1 MerR family transcriptional regulator [Undibacterium sp. YM2]